MLKTLTVSLTKKKLAFGLIISSLLFLVLIMPSVASADGFLEGTLWTLVNGVFGYMVWVGGNLLNYTITEFVIGFGAMYQSQGMGVAVNELWGLIRDIFNLLFIFGLVYIGLRLILDSENSSARRMLVNIILAALLINFSMFFSKAIIDFTNIAAAQITNAFPPSSSQVLGIGGQPLYGISDEFMRTLGLTSIWGSDGSLWNVNNGTGGSITYIFSTMIIFIIAAFVFMAGALLLAIRFAALNLFIILSPVMFLGWIFPNLSSFTTRYWHNFLGRAFFAPAYLLMLYISWKVLVSFRNLAGGGDMSKAMNSSQVQASAEFGSTIAFFIVVCVFLIASIVIAQRMSVDGASFAVGTMRGGYNRAKKKALSMANNLGRTTINIATSPARYGGRYIADKTGKRVENFMRNQQKKEGWLGSAAQNKWVNRAGMGVATSLQNVQAGTGRTRDEAIKAKQERENKERAAMNKDIKESEKNDTYDASIAALDNNTSTVDELNKALADLSKNIKGLSAEDAAKMGIKNLSRASISANISDTQLKEWEDKGVFTRTQIAELRTKRDSALAEIASNGHTSDIKSTQRTGVDQRKTILQNRRSSDYANMPASIFTQSETYQHISPSALGSRLDNDDNPPKPEELVNIKKAIVAHLGLNANETPNYIVEEYKKYQKSLDEAKKNFEQAQREIARVPAGQNPTQAQLNILNEADRVYTTLQNNSSRKPTAEMERWAKFERDSVNNGNRAHLFV